MNSIPRIPAAIIRFTALEPPPPTPRTRIRAGAASESSSSMGSRWSGDSSNVIIVISSEKVSEKLLHARQRKPFRLPMGLVPLTVEQESGRHRPLRARDDVDESSDSRGGYASTYRSVKDRLGDLEEAVHFRSAAR